MVFRGLKMSVKNEIFWSEGHDLEKDRSTGG